MRRPRRFPSSRIELVQPRKVKIKRIDETISSQPPASRPNLRGAAKSEFGRWAQRARQIGILRNPRMTKKISRCRLVGFTYAQLFHWCGPGRDKPPHRRHCRAGKPDRKVGPQDPSVDG